MTTLNDWPDETGKIHPQEFLNVGRLSPAVIKKLSDTRQILDRPMYFTRSQKGRIYHPNGDAVPPDSTSHSTASLHKFGIDHKKSMAKGKIIIKSGYPALAVDWDCGTRTIDTLFEVYLTLARQLDWSAIGVYPFWNRPGFHTDLRPRSHPAYRAHWYVGRDNKYKPLRWKTFKKEIM